MLDDDYVLVAQKPESEARELCDKLNNLSVEPIYYIKPMK